MTEQQLQSKQVKHLQSEYNAYTVVTIKCSKSGIADILACVPFTKEQALAHFEHHSTLGVFCAFESKLPGKESTYEPIQQLNAEWVRAAGGISDMTTSTTRIDELLGKPIEV